MLNKINKISYHVLKFLNKDSVKTYLGGEYLDLYRYDLGILNDKVTESFIDDMNDYIFDCDFKRCIKKLTQNHFKNLNIINDDYFEFDGEVLFFINEFTNKITFLVEEQCVIDRCILELKEALHKVKLELDKESEIKNKKRERIFDKFCNL